MNGVGCTAVRERLIILIQPCHIRNAKISDQMKRLQQMLTINQTTPFGISEVLLSKGTIFVEELFPFDNE
jgi:hypothetical protein